MKNQYLYLIVILVILVIAVLGWYYFNTTGAYIGGAQRCPRWSCADTKTYSCPNGTTNSSCSNGVLYCLTCTDSYVTKNYSVTQVAIEYQNLSGNVTLSGIFTVNNETFQLKQGQTWMLTDQTIFGVTTLYLNYSAFYLQSAYETKTSSLTAPFPASTMINLKVGKIGGSCGAGSISCPNGYTPSCSVNTLTCTGQTTNICSNDQPFSWCTKTGSSCLCPS
jgi:hypothetical protein